MPTYIIKPSRDEDFYVWWSTVVGRPNRMGATRLRPSRQRREPGTVRPSR